MLPSKKSSLTEAKSMAIAVKVGWLQTGHQAGENHADHHSVGDHDDRFAGMPGDELLEERNHAATDVGIRFAARMGVLEVAGDPALLAGGVDRPAFFARLARSGDRSCARAGRRLRLGSSVQARPIGSGRVDGPAHRRTNRAQTVLRAASDWPKQLGLADCPTHSSRCRIRPRETGRGRTVSACRANSKRVPSNVLLLASRARRWWTSEAVFSC